MENTGQGSVQWCPGQGKGHRLKRGQGHLGVRKSPVRVAEHWDTAHAVLSTLPASKNNLNLTRLS